MTAQEIGRLRLCRGQKKVKTKQRMTVVGQSQRRKMTSRRNRVEHSVENKSRQGRRRGRAGIGTQPAQGRTLPGEIMAGHGEGRDRAR